jgi:3-methyladenine DNA glycosylase/8-oxoguanine DNA glycosylase
VAHWIKLIYDRNSYVIDLDRVSAFCHSQNGRVSFAVFEGLVTIVINQQSDPAAYQKILDYVEKKTGQSLTS